MDILGTTALVTGAGSGLGAATARRLAASGAHVVAVDRDEAGGSALVADLGDRATFVQADVTDPRAVQGAIDAASAVDAPLRIVVNCAGIGIGARTIDRSNDPADLDAFRKVIEVNLVGTYNVASRAAAAMVDTDPLDHGERGVIVNTASIAAFDGQIGQTAYAASKGGVVALTLPMARDLSTVGIRVNTIAPGIIDTPLLGSVDDDMREALAAGVPFPKRLGTPDDFAGMVTTIVENGYLNGETIRMDGALRMPPR